MAVLFLKSGMVARVSAAWGPVCAPARTRSAHLPGSHHGDDRLGMLSCHILARVSPSRHRGARRSPSAAAMSLPLSAAVCALGASPASVALGNAPQRRSWTRLRPPRPAAEWGLGGAILWCGASQTHSLRAGAETAPERNRKRSQEPRARFAAGLFLVTGGVRIYYRIFTRSGIYGWYIYLYKEIIHL